MPGTQRWESVVDVWLGAVAHSLTRCHDLLANTGSCRPPEQYEDIQQVALKGIAPAMPPQLKMRRRCEDAAP